MCLSEEFIPRQPPNSGETVDEEVCKKCKSTYSPFKVPFFPCKKVSLRLWLVHEAKLHRPQKCMDKAKDKNPAAHPSVKEIEILIRNSSDQGDKIVAR